MRLTPEREAEIRKAIGVNAFDFLVDGDLQALFAELDAIRAEFKQYKDTYKDGWKYAELLDKMRSDAEAERDKLLVDLADCEKRR
jgi:hypothetical protein